MSKINLYTLVRTPQGAYCEVIAFEDDIAICINECGEAENWSMDDLYAPTVAELYEEAVARDESEA
jgi:hypothetical protein